MSEPKKRLKLDEVWREARDLVWERRGRLSAGLALMLVSRLAGLVLPATSKFLVDDVIGKGRHDLLPLLGLAAIIATLVQAATSFAISQILGVAAQRAITEMRKRVEEHVLRSTGASPGTSYPRISRNRAMKYARHRPALPGEGSEGSLRRRRRAARGSRQGADACRRGGVVRRRSRTGHGR